MHHDQLDFHNTVDLPPAPGGGVQLARFPSGIWHQAEAPAGSGTIRSSNGCEIRFVTSRPHFRLYLRSLDADSDVVLLRGNQIFRQETLPAGRIHGLNLHLPPLEPNRDPSVRRRGGFSPDVCRVVSVGGTLAYHGKDAMGGSVRPPKPDEVPMSRWLAYGSSLTQSSASFYSYVNATAQMLEVDALNLGMGGSCWIEPAVADFIAGRDDWEFASFELGINMMNPACENEGFRHKVAHLLDTVTAAHPDKPVFLITLFRYGAYHEVETTGWGRDTREKNKILREAAARYPEQVTLLEGTDIVEDFRGFQTDLLHPEPFAHTRMGLRLAEAMRPRLSKMVGSPGDVKDQMRSFPPDSLSE